MIIVGMIGGLVWGLALLRYGAGLSFKSRFELPVAMAIGFTPAGLVMVAMVGRLAQRRFFDDGIIDGQPFAPNSGADIDQRVLANTVEQIVLALCIWPIGAVFLGNGILIALGFGFAAARILFWIGYHLSPPLRGFGFAASFYPTVLTALWVLWVVAEIGG